MSKDKDIQVGIIMGSDSDLPKMKEAAEVMDEFGINYEVRVVSAHRTPKLLFEYCQGLQSRGVRVLIAGAGGAAHLPGMAASMTPIPVIGVPLRSRISLDGWDSVLSVLQMPPGIPVATVALDGAKNAGLLAVQIIGVHNTKVLDKMVCYKNDLEKKILSKASQLQKIGYQQYLKSKNLPIN